MADIVKTKSTLSLVAEFKDGDDRTLTLDNPKSTLTATQINALNTPAAAALIGDKNDAEFLRFRSARITSSTITYLDLTPQA